jgi:hypothetical protein
MWKTLITGTCLTFLQPALAQVDSVAMRYAATITVSDLRTHLDTLASDAYEGRETGMKGQRMAAAYIGKQFRKDGIPPVPDAGKRGLLPDGYQQQFPIILSRNGGLAIGDRDSGFVYMRDYAYFGDKLKSDLNTSTLAVIASASLEKAKGAINSAVVMVMDDDPSAPLGASSSSPARMRKIRSAAGAFQGTETNVVLLVDREALTLFTDNADHFNSPRMKLVKPEMAQEKEVQVVVIGPAMAQAILGEAGTTMTKAYKKASRKALIVEAPLRFTYTSKDERLTSTNVLGYVEGSDKKGELVLVTAHYDHLGIKHGEVYNGADDDGSGTVAVLEMAQAFAMAKAEGHGPRRSMLFMTVSGEEEGLLGSEWYSDHPVFPLDSTVADLNTDMIGRVDTVHENKGPYVYVIGSGRLSSELKAINERVNATYTHLDLDYTFDSDSDPNRFYYRSDHYNFAKHGIPVAFFFNGVHADYHGPNDEVDKINFDLLHQRALLTFYTAWVLANQERRIQVDHPAGDGH